MLTVGIRDRINIIPVLQMTTVAPSGSIIGLIPVSIETDSQHLHQLKEWYKISMLLLPNTNDAPTIHIESP